MTDIQFYFVVLIDIFYYGRAFGVRIDGPLARGFLRFLSLTAFQAEGGGIALSGDEYYNAAYRGHVHIEYLFSPLTSYTLSRYAGLPLKGKRGI